MKTLLTSIRLPQGVYSIRVKLAFVTSVLILVIAVFIYWFFPSRLDHQAHGAISEKANGITSMMAYSMGSALFFDDFRVVNEVIMSALQNPGVDYVVVLNDSGRIVAAYDSLRALHAHFADADFVEKISDDGKTFQTVAPVVFQKIYLGRVYLGLSLQTHNTEIGQSRSTIAWLSLCIGVLGVSLVAILSAFITKPLTKMVGTVEKIAAGDWKQRAEVTSQDEVGHLGAAFNTMVGNLELAYEDLRRSEKNYRNLFESNPHPMWVHDVDSRSILEVNDAAIECYGYTREQFLKMTIHDIILDGPFDSMDLLISRQGNLTRSTGWRHLRNDGTIIDVEKSSHSLPYRNGRKARLVLASDITKRVRAEVLLRESEERYRDLFESASDLILSVGADCNFQFVNRAWMETLGYRREETTQMHIFSVIKESELPRFKVALRDALSGKRLDRVQTVLVAKDGREVAVEGSLSTKFESNEPISTRGIFRNITERKRADEAILLQKSRFEQLFENAPIGIVLADKSGRIVQSNKKFQVMFGYNPVELNSQSIDMLIVPEHLREEGSSLSKTIIAGEPIQTETIRKRKDGSHLDVGLYGVPIIVNGSSIGLFGMYVDISDRKRAEKEIRMLAASIRGISESVTIADTNEHIVFVNNAFEGTYGYTREEVIGKPVSILRAASDESTPVLEATLEGGWHGELVNRRKDGSEFPIHLSTSFIRDEQRNIIAYVGVAEDITEAKKATLRQQELMIELESINKELNDFAYIVSHDLKAPLRAIGSLVSWLSTDYGDKLGDEGREMLETLLGRTKRMHDLIDGVLRYSRIGRAKEEAGLVDLEKLVPDIVDLIAPPEHIEVKIQRPLPTIQGENTRVQQVFQNLLSNAIKFMDKPQGLIEVGCERENGHWKFKVVDNGPGIEERHFAKIFQIFQTLSARDEYESTGIGLTIVKKIVEQYGGRIWVESQVGTGTAFYFTFPAHHKN